MAPTDRRVRRRRRASRAGGVRSDSGASIVEIALVTPLFVLTIMAVFELSFMSHNYLKATGAAGAASRAVTVAGADPAADYLAIRAIEHGLSTFELQDIELIVIYKADGPDADVPTGCLSVPVPAGLECNSYSAPDFFLSYVNGAGTATGHWGCGASARDDPWCPTDRQAALSDPGGPDHVGIFVRLKQQNLTGMFDWDRKLEINRISRIEPTAN